MAADWHGWIMAGEKARKELESLGITVGPWDSKLEIFRQCRLSGQAFIRLSHFRGKYLWKLSRIRKGP